MLLLSTTIGSMCVAILTMAGENSVVVSVYGDTETTKPTFLTTGCVLPVPPPPHPPNVIATIRIVSKKKTFFKSFTSIRIIADAFHLQLEIIP